MFRLVVPDTGAYQVQVHQLGYEKRKRHIRVEAGRATTLIFRMRRWQPGILIVDTLARAPRPILRKPTR